MRLRILPSLSLSLLLCSWRPAQAQLAPAEDYFHDGARHYLSNNIPAALQVVTNGLQQFPDDEKLKKLYELLKQQQQQQQNQQNQQQDQKHDQQKQDEKKNDQKQQDQQQSKKDQSKQDVQQQPEQQKSGGDKSKGQQDEKQNAGKPQPVEAHAMTAQEAKQLLDAQKGEEQVLVFQPQGEPKNRDKKLKDW